MATNHFESQLLNKGAMGFSGCDISLVVRVPGYNVRDQKALPDKVYRLGTLQTLSISTYNAKTPIRALGFKNPVAIARGGRTIAGTMILNQMHSHVFDENNFGAGGWVKYDDNGFLTYSSGDVEYFVNRYASAINASKKQEEERKNNPKLKESPIVLPPLDNEKRKKQWDYSWDTTISGQRIKPSDLPPFDIIILFLNEAGNAGKIILYGVEIVHDSQTLSVEDIYTEVQYQYIARDIDYFDHIDIAGTSVVTQYMSDGTLPTSKTGVPGASTSYDSNEPPPSYGGNAPSSATPPWNGEDYFTRN